MVLDFLIILINIVNLIILSNILFTVYKNDKNFNKESLEKEETAEEPVYFQQQMYDVKRFRERMQKMKEESETDEDGLYDVQSAITLEQLGMFTGVEETNE